MVTVRPLPAANRTSSSECPVLPPLMTDDGPTTEVVSEAGYRRILTLSGPTIWVGLPKNWSPLTPWCYGFACVSRKVLDVFQPTRILDEGGHHCRSGWPEPPGRGPALCNRADR